MRFNNTYGDTFAVPKAVTPAVGARIMDLQNPTTKMSKSAASTSGVIFLNDSNEQIDKKFRKAVTDNDSEIRFDIEQKPGVSNLISILAAASGTAHADIETLASGKSYGWLKAEASESVQAAVTPIRERLSELLEDKDKLMAIAAQNAEQARALASPVYVAARNAMGLGNFPI